jgi:uncharacterized membrane protein
MKRINLTAAITPVIIILAFIISAGLYPALPEKMASHWNAAGEVDGYMSRAWATFLMPGVLILMYLMFLIIPAIDPLKKNIEKFRGHFDRFILAIVIFMAYIHGLTMTWNLGYRFDMTMMILPAVGLLFILVGSLLNNAKRNWFIGIRTPWTLSSEKVWDKTHRLGARLFVTAGIVSLLGIVFTEHAFWLLIVPIIGATVFLVVYSYFLYREEKENV